MTTDPAAEVIADELLYLTGRAIHLGEFDMFKVHFMLPLVVETLQGEEIMRTEADLRTMFEAVQAHLSDNAITELVRTIVSSEFFDTETVGSTHVSKALDANGATVGAPYPTYSILRRTKDGWKIARCRVVFLKNPIHEGVLPSTIGREGRTP